MGVELSPKTRLPDEEIDKKLRSAIDSAQSFKQTIDELPINPSSFPLWSTDGNRPALTDAVKRASFVEQDAFIRARSQGQQPFPLYVNAFMDFRQTLVNLGHYADRGAKYIAIQDKSQEYGICMRIVEVREIKPKVPMFIVCYGRASPTTPITVPFNWLSERMEKEEQPAGITSTLEEQDLMLTFLDVNSKRLAPNYNPARTSSEDDFMLSFLLPTGPVSQVDIGRLVNYPGCVICGKEV
ncbi:hypothetical protein MPER_01841, partial [Moniliophthora perniciosa FA553]